MYVVRLKVRFKNIRKYEVVQKAYITIAKYIYFFRVKQLLS